MDLVWNRGQVREVVVMGEPDPSSFSAKLDIIGRREALDLVCLEQRSFERRGHTR